MGKFSRLGNDLYTGHKSIDFMGRRRLWYAMSGLIIVAAVLGLYFKGLNMGIEFVGGAEYRVSLPSSQVNQGTADRLRQAVVDTGIPAAKAAVATTAGTNAITVDVEPLTNAESAKVADTILSTAHAQRSQLSQDEVGASWGKEVAKRSLIGLVVFLVLVVLFIWAYFRQWKMSLAAMVALAHDVVITVGIYALSGFEVTPATVTGILTILGFSLYDTVVVFDKVRENTKSLRATHQTYSEAANLAVNQTLVRSINTSFVALIPVGCILYVGAVQLGSGSLKDLALALFVGMAAGAYSSIFIATPLLAQLKSREPGFAELEKRVQARRRHQVDPYASVPSYAENMPLVDEPGSEPAVRQPPREQLSATPASRVPDATGRGRTVPPARGPVRPSNASGRQQPSRETKSKRGKK